MSARIPWHDLTVPDASAVGAFYADVLGVALQPVAMGGYDDFCLVEGESPIGGVCHARGSNADVPPVWLLYFSVPDLDAALERVASGGGSVLVTPRPAGGGRFAVIRDPAGAVCGLYSDVKPA
jgi:predicted enzyme related to lactoylglutathione lyase